MISPINFTGSVHYLGNTKHSNKNHSNEVYTIQHYADVNDVDIAVLNRFDYTDNSGFYTAIATKADGKEGRPNNFKKVTFDFGYNRREITESKQAFTVLS